MNQEKFIVRIDQFWPDYWENFLHHCNDIADKNNWNVRTVINYQLKPYGKWIPTRTQGSYLRWDHEKYHTLFLLKWS